MCKFNTTLLRMRERCAWYDFIRKDFKYGSFGEKSAPWHCRRHPNRMAHVVVRVGNNLIESIITRNSAEELRLKKGDSVRVVVKSTEVMIQKD